MVAHRRVELGAEQLQLSHMVSDPCMGDTTIPACGTAPCRIRERTWSTGRTLE
jgi:hypothetical protein